VPCLILVCFLLIRLLIRLRSLLVQYGYLLELNVVAAASNNYRVLAELYNATDGSGWFFKYNVRMAVSSVVLVKQQEQCTHINHQLRDLLGALPTKWLNGEPCPNGRWIGVSCNNTLITDLYVPLVIHLQSEQSINQAINQSTDPLDWY
jgi:hypothetical protein